jgi:hypothetical protein
MPDPSSPFAQPAAWWGAIQGSVRARATTAEVWGAIRDFGEANGLAYPPDMFRQVNRLRSTAAGLRIASEHLGSALNSDALTGSMVAPTIYARPATSRDVLSKYHVRVGYEAIRGGQVEQSYVTLEYTGALPSTVGQLRDDAEGTAEGLVLASGTHSGGADSFVGVLTLEIGEY